MISVLCAIIVIYILWGDDVNLNKNFKGWKLKNKIITVVLTTVAVISGTLAILDSDTFKTFTNQKCNVEMKMIYKNLPASNGTNYGTITFEQTATENIPIQSITIAPRYLEIISNKSGCIKDINIKSYDINNSKNISLMNLKSNSYGNLYSKITLNDGTYVRSTALLTEKIDSFTIKYEHKRFKRFGSGEFKKDPTLNTEVKVIDHMLLPSDCKKCNLGIYHDLVANTEKPYPENMVMYNIDIVSIEMESEKVNYLVYSLVAKNEGAIVYSYNDMDNVKNYSSSMTDDLLNFLQKEVNVNEICSKYQKAFIDTNHNACNFYNINNEINIDYLNKFTQQLEKEIETVNENN